MKQRTLKTITTEYRNGEISYTRGDGYGAFFGGELLGYTETRLAAEGLIDIAEYRAAQAACDAETEQSAAEQPEPYYCTACAATFLDNAGTCPNCGAFCGWAFEVAETPERITITRINGTLIESRRHYTADAAGRGGAAGYIASLEGMGYTRRAA